MVAAIFVIAMPQLVGDVIGRALLPVRAGQGFPTQLTHKGPGELREGFMHSLGHGVGLAVHERPLMGRRSDALVEGDEEVAMLGFGKVTCSFCDGRVSSKAALRARDWRDIVICTGCYEGWANGGRTCIQCGATVQDGQMPSAFLKPRRAFGHADCGGLRLLR